MTASTPTQSSYARWVPFSAHDFKQELSQLAKQSGSGAYDIQLAQALDDMDKLALLRSEYVLPSMKDAGVKNGEDTSALYLCGNSLGPLSKRSRKVLSEEVDAWGAKGVLGHWDHPHGRPWTKQEERVGRLMSDVVGAKPSEVTAMATLTGNLHTMLATFYRPAAPLVGEGKKIRQKIIYEAKAFPSDQYALASAVALAGFDPRKALIALKPRQGETTLRTEDVIQAMEDNKDDTAVIMMGGIQYFSGQLFDIPAITKRGRELGIIVGWDLAHAFANVPLALHDWDVDFAVWCTYKYGSSGPGGIAGAFVHERWGSIGMQTHLGGEANKGVEGLLRPAGWWGHNKSTRFTMPDSFDAMSGAAGWQVSNPSMLDIASLLGSLETLAGAPGLLDASAAKLDVGSEEHAAEVEARTEVGMGSIMPALRSKSQRLTAYLEHLLLQPDFLPGGKGSSALQILTPADPAARGSQLSIRIPDRAKAEQASVSDSTVASADGEVPPPIASTTLVARAHKRAQQQDGLIADIRNPDVMRLAPLAQFSSYSDVWRAAEALRKALLAEL